MLLCFTICLPFSLRQAKMPTSLNPQNDEAEGWCRMLNGGVTH